jgi:hypothetical protein
LPSFSFYQQLKEIKMGKINCFLVAAVLLTFMACQKDITPSSLPSSSTTSSTTNGPTRVVNLLDTLTIKMNETVVSGNFSIKLDSITSDSRCPTDFTCVWAGAVDAKLLVKKDMDNQFLRLTTQRLSVQGLSDTATVFTHFIKFLDVAPTAKSGVQTLQKDYVIRLLVK